MHRKTTIRLCSMGRWGELREVEGKTGQAGATQWGKVAESGGNSEFGEGRGGAVAVG